MSHIISQSDLQRIHHLIEERTGLAAHRQSSDALEEQVLNLSGGELETYYQRLEQARDTDPIWQDLVDAFTIGETYFLRDKAHFQLLREHILPDIIRRKRQQRQISIWSMGCASGEEPYSLAITLHELLPDLDNWNIDILGTDINEKALHFARRGSYRQWAFRHTDLDFQGRYFDPVKNMLQIKPHVQRLVRFRQANLFSKPIISNCDLILCRNVLIYFGGEHIRRAETILYDAAAPGGWLLLGHSETLQFNREQWINGLFPSMPIYQKADQVKTGNSKPATQFKRRTLTMEIPVVRIDERTQALTPEEKYRAAVEAVHNEAFDTAEQLVRDILAMNPDHARAHTLLATVYANRNQIKDAHRVIDEAVYDDPLVADAYYLRALLYMEENREDEVHKALVAALYCQLHHPLASYMLGNIYAQSGDIKRAHHYWQNTLEAIANIDDDEAVSDISPITARQLQGLVSEQITGWE